MQPLIVHSEMEAKRHQKDVEQMYKDVMTGGLRKRTAGRDAFDMDDSDDEAEMRRRKWQRERQRMTKAAFQADERIGKLGKNFAHFAVDRIRVNALSSTKYQAAGIHRHHDRYIRQLGIWLPR